jgi:hypothetical protein
MVTRERFEQGMTFQQYLDQMGTNKETFAKFLAEIKIRPEDWCGDALYNVPVLAKLVEGNPNIETRVFLRDKNADLMDQYLNQGMYRSIPVFAFFDENMNEVARLLERPSKITDQLEKKMLEVRRSMRSENLEQWRQDVVGEVRSLLKA